MGESARKASHLQTVNALRASDLAAALNEALQKVRIPPGDYAPELTAPEGPSTAGGVQAMQHLRLVPYDKAQPTLVVGHANHADGKAELRTYEHMEALHRQRFQRDLALDRTHYDAFLGFAKQLFESLRLQTSLVGPPAELAHPAAAPDLVPPRSRFLIPAIAAVLVLATLVVAWALLRSG
ncbi:MAG: hypothetical protein JOZ69_06035 [Myxococcales bacterium]|nr:hypothetical protein [Myxococcales bacterium]